MKRLHINEIKLGKKYFAVCCGNISTVTFEEINIPKIKVSYKKYSFTYYISDIGIKYENESYINDLNRVFETEEEAIAFIHTVEYKHKLYQQCDEFDYWLY